MADLQAWESSVLGQHLDTDGLKDDAGQCSQVPLSWAHAIYPDVPVSQLLPEVGSNNGVKDWAGKSTKYFTWIANDVNDINQLPIPGDIMVFDATPKKGYADQFNNPFGHTGVCKSASVSGYTLIQQNAPRFGEGVNDTSYPWKLLPCLGWFRSVNQFSIAPVPAPAPAPVMSSVVGKTLHLPKYDAGGKPDNVWHVYNVDGPYDLPHAVNVLDPYMYDGLDYVIQKDLGNGIYVINTHMFGPRAIWTRGTDATIS